VTALAALAMAPSPSEKAALRLWAEGRRDALDDASRTAAIARAAQRIDDEIFGCLAPGAVVALYAAIRNELPADLVAAAAARRGLAVAYPRVVRGDRVLRFHLASPTDLRPGTFGIPEPTADRPAVALDDLAVVVVPALLFDRAGRRLGWGGGYYDTTLPATPAVRVGLAFELQLVDELPAAAHDQPVHLIATDVALHDGAPGPRPWTS
jgi:5-formyltetrahydrofolate cyclo-ligase